MKSLPIEYMSKGWGYESIIVNNEKYCGKLLFFKKGKHCSFHYHLKKRETFYCHSGRLLVVHSMEDCMNPNGHITIRGDNIIEISSLISTWTAPTIAIKSEAATVSILEPGDVFEVPVGLRHAMYGLLDTEMFEFSTHHEDEDSIRILKGD